MYLKQRTTNHLQKHLALSLLLLIGLSVGNPTLGDEISKDFGPYTENAVQLATNSLQALGDWNNSTADLSEALNNFYSRTGLPVSDDPVQQIIDIDMVASAEREAQRALAENDSDSTRAYVRVLAPWLQDSVSAGNDSVLAETTTPAENTSTPAMSTVSTTAAEEKPVDNLLDERSLLSAVVSELNNTLNGLSTTVESLY